MATNVPDRCDADEDNDGLYDGFELNPGGGQAGSYCGATTLRKVADHDNDAVRV